MPNPIVFSIKNDFTGGINFRADQFQLAENESPFLMNMDVDPRGGAFSRAGIQLKHSTPVGVAQTTWNPKGLFNYALAGTPTIMLTTGENADPGEVWYSTGGDFSRLQISVDVTAASYSTISNATSYTTSTAHDFLVGQTITVAGTTPSSYSTTAAVGSIGSPTTFSFSSFNGNPSSALATPSTTFTASGTSVVAAATYTGVTQSATSGSGTGAVFTITKTGGGTAYSGFITVTVTSGGSGYKVGNTITIPGLSLGGTTPTNNLTLTVATKADGLYVSGGTATGPTTLTVEESEGASITQWEESVYFTRGIDLTSCTWTYPAFADATTLIASGTGNWQPYITPSVGYMPKAKHCRNHANKLFVAHTREDGLEYPNRLRWSHEGLPDNWAEEDYIDITAGGNGIRGLAIVDGQLLIFKPKATYLLMGYENDNFQLVEVSTIHGVEFPGQIAEGDGGVYFFDFPKGLFFYNRNGMQDLFLRLEPIIINNEVGQDALDQITLSFVNNRLWISMPYNPTPNSVSPDYACVNFVFDSSIGQYGAYTMYQHISGYGFVHGCDWRDSSDNNWALMLTPNTSNISPAVTEAQFVVYVDDYENAVEDDVWNGTAAVETLFPTTYTTSWFDESRYVQDKTFVGPNYVLKEVEATTTVTVQVFYNYNSTDVRRTQQIQLVPDASSALAGFYGSTTLPAPPGTEYDGTAVYGTNSIGPSLISGQRLGRCRAVQLTFLGPLTIFSPPGRKWGINSIAYKFKRRNIKNR